jgi:hypothetical protein
MKITDQQILNAPVASCFKGALMSARRGFISTYAGCLKTSYRVVGATLARHVRNSDCEDECIEAILARPPVPDEPDVTFFKTAEEPAWKRSLGWLQRHRSRYLDLIPPRHREAVAEAFVEELDDA